MGRITMYGIKWRYNELFGAPSSWLMNMTKYETAKEAHAARNQMQIKEGKKGITFMVEELITCPKCGYKESAQDHCICCGWRKEDEGT